LVTEMRYQSSDPRIVFQDEGGGCYALDVRELLADGGQPYDAIMTCVRQLAPGERLDVHALFEPVPLVRKLERQGYTLAAQHAGEDHWVVGITKA
jgi:uncharacterized protein (DUF2249 family)